MCYAPALVGGGLGPTGGHLQCDTGRHLRSCDDLMGMYCVCIQRQELDMQLPLRLVFLHGVAEARPLQLRICSCFFRVCVARAMMARAMMAHLCGLGRAGSAATILAST